MRYRDGREKSLFLFVDNPQISDDHHLLHVDLYPETNHTITDIFVLEYEHDIQTPVIISALHFLG